MSDHSTSQTLDTPVLIVGCGPSGMTMAIALSQCGIPSTIIDRRTGISQSPRAHALNCRTLEIFAALGVDIAALRKVATPDAESSWVRWIDTLSGGEFGAVPYERMHAPENVPTPHPLFNIAQPAAEQVLLEHVQTDSNIRVERGLSWRECEQTASGVRSVLENAEGQEQTISSRYVIAADGASSPLRESQNIAMDGPGVIQKFKNVHFRADLSPLVAHKPAILYWVLKQSCTGTFIAYDIRDNWTFMYPYDAATVDAATLTDEVCLQLARDAIGDDSIELELISVREWEMTSEVAQHYRSQNIFLVGDAAHRYPPSGGLGLNTGVGDAHNLAWKLAGVLQGWAPEDLLDSYERERRPVAGNNADFSLENAMKMIDVFNHSGVFSEPGAQPSLEAIKADTQQWQALQSSIDDQRVHFDGLALHIGAHYGRSEAPDPFADEVQFSQVGARLPHVWLSSQGQRISSLDLLSSSKFTLLIGPDSKLQQIDISAPHNILRSPEDFTGDAAALAELGLANAAILVRPDGHIAALLPNAESITHALEQVTSVGLAA